MTDRNLQQPKLNPTERKIHKRDKREIQKNTIRETVTGKVL